MPLLDNLTHPLMAMCITIGSFLAAQWLQKKANNHNLLNPVVIAILMVVLYIVALDIDYKDYLKNVDMIHALLGPATVALAIPLYNQLDLIKKSARAITVAVRIAAITAAGVGFTIANLMGAEHDIQLAIIPKSVTTAIAIGIAENINTDPSLAVFFVFTTGIIGSLIASPLFKLFRITDDRAIGLALGTTCHGLGVARAFQHSSKAGAFSALGMSLMGVISGIILPIFVMWLIAP